MSYKSNVMTTLKHLKSNKTISLKKEEDYIVLGWHDKAGVKLLELMEGGWQEVA